MQGLSGWRTGVGKGWRGGRLFGEGSEQGLGAMGMEWGEAGGAGAMASVSLRAARSSALEQGALDAFRPGLMEPAFVFRVVNVMLGLRMYSFMRLHW